MNDLKSKKSDETRKKIVRAFDECVAANGYAQTKLVDIADAAGLATPHLRYYFRNKESILEYQYEHLVSGFERAVATITAESPIAWFEALGRLTLGTGTRSTQALLVLIEANSLVARSTQMKKLKRQYDQQTLDAIEQQLRATDTPDPETATPMIFHFLTGLMLNTAFESKRTREKAIPFFMQFVARIIGSKS